ncbi:hypothetical protein [Amycolatopsis sp. NPDC004625]|uniref:hypothetical protein n=1 Tax=Amycolatopsis sp. NPDC004625 TaxID=3154670 RepID=UPI0033A106BE
MKTRIAQALLVSALTLSLAAPPASAADAGILVECSGFLHGRTGKRFLYAGDCMSPDSFLETPWHWVDGRYEQLTLAFQGDGNLVQYRWIQGQGYGTAIWSTNTYGVPAGSATLQRDGNFVLYDNEGDPYWSTNTWNCPGHWDWKEVELQDDENVVLYMQSVGGNTRYAKWDAWGNAHC